MNAQLTSAVQLLGRILLAWIFIRGGIGKFGAHDATVGYIAKNGFPAPELAYWGAVLTELGGGLLCLVGFQTRWVGLWLAVFCLWTGLQVHYQPADAGQMVHFFKNLCMAGGFLQLFAAGGGMFSVDGMLGQKSTAEAV